MDTNLNTTQPGLPKITVLMPIYNGEAYLREAIESILGQTFRDFEFLIIDDGSTDRSVEIVGGYKDDRIRLVRNGGNLGLVATLNRGIGLARGEYIARMDCDDISLPERFAKQVAFMEAHPQVGVCGTWARVIDTSGRAVSTLRSPKGSAAKRLCWRPTPFIHPACMVRADLLKQEGYSERYPHAEDYELWLRLSGKTDFANIGEYLLLYRVHGSNIGKTRRAEQLANAYTAFAAFVGPPEIGYQGFLSLVPAATGVNPVVRARFWLRAAAKTGFRIDEFVLDNLVYLKLWATGYRRTAE